MASSNVIVDLENELMKSHLSLETIDTNIFR
jgi:hypothetical protein